MQSVIYGLQNFLSLCLVWGLSICIVLFPSGVKDANLLNIIYTELYQIVSIYNNNRIRNTNFGVRQI